MCLFNVLCRFRVRGRRARDWRTSMQVGDPSGTVSAQQHSRKQSPERAGLFFSRIDALALSRRLGDSQHERRGERELGEQPPILLLFLFFFSFFFFFFSFFFLFFFFSFSFLFFSFFFFFFFSFLFPFSAKDC